MLALLAFLLGLQHGAAAQEPSGASAYLAGVFDIREDRTTVLSIINPTATTLRVAVVLFDDNEKLLHCVIFTDMSANALEELDVRGTIEAANVTLGANITALTGVVKVFALAHTGEVRPQIGIVGNQRLERVERPVSETELHAIQSQFLEYELPLLKSACGP